MSAGFVLRVENGAQAGQAYPLAAPSVVIGRHSEADIVLNGNQVSRRHARLELVDSRAILTDLNSANGTFVNGTRLATPQPLNPGDLIELGEYRLRVEGPGPTSVATVAATAQDYTATQFVGAVVPEPSQIAAGTILNGRYRLDRTIGQGGFARVFLANDLALKRPIAVKVMNVELVGESSIEDFLARFANEAQAIANLDHPHILAVYDFGQLGSTGFLIMPYVAGGTVGDALRAHGRFAPQLASRYLRQVASALDYAHRRSLVHRDIKPQNMLLRAEDDHLLLADFGIAKVLTATSAQSRTGVVGTIAYMAPEQFQGQVSRATDVYALGCVLFQWLTGKLPYGGSTEQVIFGHISAPVPLLADCGADLPPAAQTVIARALAKLPEDRFQSAGDLAAAFDAALAAPATTRLIDTPAMPAGDPTVAIAAPSPPPAPPARTVTPPTVVAPPEPPPTQLADAQRQFNRLAELEKVPERKPAPTPPPPATSLTIPALVVAVLALIGSVIAATTQFGVIVVDNAGSVIASAAVDLVAIWLIRAAALQRTSPTGATVAGSLLRALPLLLPSCAVVGFCLAVGPRSYSDLSIPAYALALALASIGPLIVPDRSPTHRVGPTLSRAAALALSAVGVALLPAIRVFLYATTPLDYTGTLAPAALLCLVGVIVAILVLHGIRRFVPRLAYVLWIPALLLALAGSYWR